ncbi:MAG: hypothetical protein MJ105_03340 [Lachnospiraceae bacterium]|nr:hypothetical protein [Lachnospiraceae bacterium]
MKKRILAYLAYIDKIINYEIPTSAPFSLEGDYTEKKMKMDVVPTSKDYDALLSRHLEQIAFFQHERLIHLMVTILFAILTFATFFVTVINFSYGMLGLMGALLVLLVPYIKHYYLLENGVQKMYKQYDELVKRKLK